MVKIASFLPSATEIVFALDAGDWLVGVTDKCNYPPEAKSKPVVVTWTLNTDELSSAEIDDLVSKFLSEGGSLYRVDVEAIKASKPEIILAQSICNVCAASNPEVDVALKVVPDAKVVWLNPSTVEDVLNDIVKVAEALGLKERGEKLSASLRQRLDAVKSKTLKVERRPRVWVAEWVDPPYCCGHWVPQMVEIAGGIEGLGKIGKPSRRICWYEVLDWQPEVIVLAPCGLSVEQTLRDAKALKRLPNWDELPAVKSGQVYAFDGDYFTCPSLRLIDGVETLAHLLHPQLFPASPVPFAKLK